MYFGMLEKIKMIAYLISRIIKKNDLKILQNALPIFRLCKKVNKNFHLFLELAVVSAFSPLQGAI